MIIDRIELTNFRSYDHLVLDITAPRTLLIGPNGAGKSTIIDAISWALRGRCRGVDGKGAGQRDLIRTGTDQATVKLNVQGIGPIQRIVNAGGAESNLKTDAILAKLRTDDTTLMASLYGSTFFQLHHADAKALLLNLLQVRIEPKDLPGYPIQAPITLGELDLAYDVAKQDRAGLKKALQAVHVPDKPKVVSIDLGGKTPKQLTAEAADLQKALLRLASEKANAQHALGQLQAQAQTLRAAIAAKGDVGGQLKAHQDMLKQHEAALAAAHDALDKAEAMPGEPVGDLQSQVSGLQTIIDKINRHDPDRGCVLATTIPCLTKASEFASQVDILKRDIKALQTKIKAGNDRVVAIAAAKQAVAGADRNVTYHRAQIEQLTAKLMAADQAADDLAKLDDELPAAERTLTTASQALDQAAQQSEGIMAKYQAVTAYQAQLDAHEAGARKAAELTEQVAEAERIVALLGPTGARAKVLQAAVGDFELAINAALAPFQFELSIQADPWLVRVKHPQIGEAVPFQLLSKGEQLWTGLAFQLALAALSGLNFCVIDDAEAVVGANRERLTKLVMMAPVTQVIVAMAKAEDDPVPEIDGLQVVRADQVSAAV